MGIYLPSARTLGCVVWPGAGIACSQGISTNFYPPGMTVGPPVLGPPPLHVSTPLCPSLCLPHLPVSMKVASLNPWLSDFHPAKFF